jgi:hypothetical protein
VPQGALADNIDNVGFGLSINGGISTDQLPILVGADFSFLVYGTDRRNEPFSTTIPDVTVDVVTSNNIAMGHFLVRLRPPSGLIRPYLDGLFGFKYFVTETRIENERFSGDEPIATSTNFDDATVSYGAGGGVDIRVARGDEGRPAIGIHLGIRYLLGGEASYLKEGSIRREGGVVSYDILRSETDMLLTDIGVTFRF